MSASLVGSEMCIRDSLGWNDLETCKCQLGAEAAASNNLCPPTFDHAVTVSYTHLTLPTICSV
eukprot:10739898-Alexandrium_andersonii.AAC.1